MKNDDPLVDTPTERGSVVLGLASVVLAAAAAVGLTIFLIWHYDLSAWWGFLFYPLIGTVLTFVFSALSLLLPGPRSGGFAGRLMPTRRSLPVSLQSPEQKPPR